MLKDINKLAETISTWSKKGDELYIEGRIDNRSYDKDDGTKGYIQFGSGSGMPKIGGNGSGRLNMANIPSYASNAAAISGGLSFGDIYRNGDNLCIVHA